MAKKKVVKKSVKAAVKKPVAKPVEVKKAEVKEVKKEEPKKVILTPKNADKKPIEVIVKKPSKIFEPKVISKGTKPTKSEKAIKQTEALREMLEVTTEDAAGNPVVVVDNTKIEEAVAEISKPEFAAPEVIAEQEQIIIDEKVQELFEKTKPFVENYFRALTVKEVVTMFSQHLEDKDWVVAVKETDNYAKVIATKENQQVFVLVDKNKVIFE